MKGGKVPVTLWNPDKHRGFQRNDEGWRVLCLSYLKKRFDEFLEREILCTKILPEQPSLIYEDDSQAFVPFSKNIITFLCMAYYPENGGK